MGRIKASTDLGILGEFFVTWSLGGKKSSYKEAKQQGGHNELAT
jgi:hypothetical protein